MGCSMSLSRTRFPREWMQEFRSIQLTDSEIQRIHAVFLRISCGNKIRTAELLTFLGTESTKVST
jgi:hypothetical protein